MRLVMKGGIWKNTEDEILKAAVMKYGKTQWARVASLLPRKTAKACKARWYEWLDPTIKKTEWTREEEEKLLHLAKLMPSQWRTIAPLVGRTATQCLEHYEKLLDAAQDKEIDPRDDPRRLAPGEIDPLPEAKPARPDPVDMDEDEKEMLSEARARLANTRGKKAKRKAREKQLEEARRLAALQKRRELKAAGIEVTRRKVRKSRGIDYATEIPFQKPVPAGVYDTSAEDERYLSEKQDPRFVSKRLHELEEKRRDREEDKARIKDKARMKRLAKVNLPLAVAATAALNDTSTDRKRSKLALPAPQVTDAELEEIAKAGTVSEDVEGLTADASAATRVLMGQYGATPIAATPMRTPRVPASADPILEEARNLAALTAGATPLLGGANPELSQGTGFSGATPVARPVQTPNVLLAGGAAGATPMQTPGATPFGGRGRMVAGGLPGATPLRDDLSINRDDDDGALSVMGGGSRRAERQRQREAVESLRSQLGELPAPRFTYEVDEPEANAALGGDGAAADDDLEEDAADVEARRAALEAAREAAEFARRSAALKHEPALPRVAVIEEAALSQPGPVAGGRALEAASALIGAELADVLKYDNAKYPVRTKSSRRRRIPAIERFTDEELAQAAMLVAEEERAVRTEAENKMGAAVTPEVVDAAVKAAADDVVFVPSRQAAMAKEEASPEEYLEGLKAEFEAVQAQLAKDGKRVDKAAHKVNLLTAGFVKRAQTGAALLARTAAQLDDRSIEYECFQRLKADELAALPQRLSAATAEAADQTEAERELQERYARLMASWGAGRVPLSVGAADGAAATANGSAPPHGDASAGVTMALDLQEDTVTITNRTDKELRLSGWVLESDVGSQSFSFPEAFALASGAKVTVWSGRHAKKHADPPRHLFWTSRHMWNNKGDTAVLKDGDRDVVARVEEKP